MEERTLMPPDHQNNTAGSAGARAMERSGQENNLQALLKCPRCDSSNTKFCYYNNYSLSQPRHFCKACKRYWTRGGTLRNVPVGGGCRKNKRVKKPSNTTTPSDPPIPPLSLPNPSQIDVPRVSTDLNPLFYGLPSASSDMNLSFPTFRSRLEQNNIPMPCTAYDLQPQLNALGLGFPHNPHNDPEYPSGFKDHLTQNYQLATPAEAVTSAPSSLLQDYTLFGSSLSSAAAASLLASSLKQPKMASSGLLPFEDLHASANGNLGLYKDVKVEEEANVVMNHNKSQWFVPCENPLEPGVADSSLYWNAMVGSWPDSSNYGSSVTPLI